MTVFVNLCVGNTHTSICKTGVFQKKFYILILNCNKPYTLKRYQLNKKSFSPPPPDKKKAKIKKSEGLFIQIAFDIKAYPVLFRYHGRLKNI